ncbi:MAG: hypothetical protein ACXVY6_09965 [Gaiellaceae bacterium]
MGLVVAVTAILNLDTSVWFLTPVLVHAARARSRRAAVSPRLGLGSNLFVTGSLSAYLWWRAAQTVAAPTSVKTYARIGVVLVPLSMAAALIALQLFSNG